jgi:hypothetical protein
LQKALKDKIPVSTCDLEDVMWFHVECPDYLKKFDDPKYAKWLKRQMYNILTVPYMSMRLTEFQVKNRQQEVIDLTKKNKFIEYPEEILPIENQLNNKVENILSNEELRSKFFEGVTFDKDPPKEE